jgi:phage terminase small subunit
MASRRPTTGRRTIKPDALPLRERRFVAEYMLDFNATRSAIRAGYSEKSAYALGPELTKKPRVAGAIAVAFAERSARTKIDADWVVHELRELYARCVEYGKVGVARQCLETLAKHTGGFSDRLEIDAKLEIDFAGAKGRIAERLARLAHAKKPA